MAAVLFVFVRVTPSFAQGEPPSDAPRFRVRIGPLTIDPTVSLANLGIDQNVFNEPVDQDPKRDFTFTVVPQADWRLRIARMVVTGIVREELVWYQKYAGERAANTTYTLGWQMPLNRLSFKLNATHASMRDRPGFEIDQRSQRTETAYDGSVEVRVMPKTFVGVTVGRKRIDFDKAVVFLDSNLQYELNRATTSAALSLRYKLTPITSVSLAATRTEERFEFSSLRDANSSAVAASIVFDPFGIIRGTATVGYTDFEPVTPGLSNFKGATAAVDLSYRLLGNTRVGFAAVRDVGFSYDINQPYYVQTGFSGSVVREVYGPFDVLARVGVQRLAYRDRVGAGVDVRNRVDRIRSVGGGIGYHLGKGVRLGLNIDKTNRVSDVAQRQYEGLRFGAAVTYGF